MGKKAPIIDGLNQALDIARGTATMGRINTFAQNLQISYDFAEDKFKVIDRNAKQTDEEDIRIVNNFKQLTLHEDRYSCDVLQLIIEKFKEEKWHKNPDLLIYVFMTSFDLKQSSATEIVIKLLNDI